MMVHTTVGLCLPQLLRPSRGHSGRVRRPEEAEEAEARIVYNLGKYLLELKFADTLS